MNKAFVTFLCSLLISCTQKNSETFSDANRMARTALRDGPRAWVFFDLGNTIIEVKENVHQKYYPGAHEYLQSLRDAGFGVGLLVNIPEAWGKTPLGRLSELVRFMDGLRQREYPDSKWVGDKEFDWNDFDEIILPNSDRERKPAPEMFKRALKISDPCPALYQGEDVKELRTAERLGFATYEVGKGNDFWVRDVKVYLKENLRISDSMLRKCGLN